MDKSTACQHALALLGETNFEKHTAPKSACDLAYADVVRYANNAHHWSFARQKRTLAPIGNNTSAHYKNYRIPADCLKIISLTNPQTNTKIPHWQIYSGIIEVPSASALDTLTLTYTSDLLSAQTNLPDQAPDFCQYIIHLLAARIAPSITGQIELSSLMEQKAAAILAQAIYKDARQSSSNDQAPITADLLTHYDDTPQYYSGRF